MEILFFPFVATKKFGALKKIMRFTKYHALGNDYIVVDPKDLSGEITPREIKVLCDRHYGIGSDGILYGPLKSDSCDFALRIFNPDASEAEKAAMVLEYFPGISGIVARSAKNVFL